MNNWRFPTLAVTAHYYR